MVVIILCACNLMPTCDLNTSLNICAAVVAFAVLSSRVACYSRVYVASLYYIFVSQMLL